MKKFLILSALVGISGLAHATTISAPSSLIGNNVLDGNNAYSWGVAVSVPSGQQVVSAEIDFSNIKLNHANSSGVGYLYTDLLNSKSTGVSAITDGDASGDYFVSHAGAGITALGTQFFAAVGTTLTWSYVLSASQLVALNSYLTADGGILNIGLDPDCSFNVGGLSITYTLGTPNHNTVPDVATTALLLVLGLAGLELFRRQWRAAQQKA